MAWSLVRDKVVLPVTTYNHIDGWVDIWPENKYYKLLKIFQRARRMSAYDTTFLMSMCFLCFLCTIVIVFGGF